MTVSTYHGNNYRRALSNCGGSFNNSSQLWIKQLITEVLFAVMFELHRQGQIARVRFVILDLLAHTRLTVG